MGFFENRRYRGAIKELHRHEAAQRQLFDEAEFSEIPTKGLLAIVVSAGLLAQDRGLPIEERNRLQDGYQEQRLRKADKIKQVSDQTGAHASAEILEEPNKDTVLDYLACRTVSSMVFIGPGTATHAQINAWGQEIDWRDAAKNTDHLKMGYFNQFMYGEEPIKGKLCIPLGTFVVSNPFNVMVSVNPSGEERDDIDRLSVMPTLGLGQSVTSQIVDYSERLKTRIEFKDQ